MADFYKSLINSRDVVNTRTLLHEAIPLTGTIVSGTYVLHSTHVAENIKNYSHGMFTSIYDYPYLSSSANHIFDISVGVSPNSGIYSSVTNQQSKKKNIYNQMAQVLMGYDHTGSVLEFDKDGNILAGGTKIQECFFMNFSRLLVKDEIKKGSFELELGVTPGNTLDGNSIFGDRIKITDYSGSDGYFVNSPVGEYGILYATQSAGNLRLASPNETNNVLRTNEYHACGLLFYQAGVAVISGSVFMDDTQDGILNSQETMYALSMSADDNSNTDNFTAILTGSEVSGAATNIMNRIYNLQFNNTVELNSTIYYCRANHNEFNYSTNPTYLSGSKIRVKVNSTDTPVSYITTVGLYNDNNELMAVGKLSEPLKKTPDTEFTIRARLDY